MGQRIPALLIRLVCAIVLVAACRDQAPAKQVTIDCDAYVAHLETVMAAHIETYPGEQRERARQHFADTNPGARVELLAKCKAIRTTTADKLDCVMTATTPGALAACPDF